MTERREEIAHVSFQGRVVRFRPVGYPTQWRIVVAESEAAISLAQSQRATVQQLTTRIQAVARSSGLIVRLVAVDDHELVFEVRQAG